MRSKEELREELLSQIDSTLDQLIENAHSLKQISSHNLFQEEIEALQKTQESLLARLVHISHRCESGEKNEESKKGSAAQKDFQKDFQEDSWEKKIELYMGLNQEILHSLHKQRKTARASRYQTKNENTSSNPDYKLVQKPRIGRNRKPIKTN